MENTGSYRNKKKVKSKFTAGLAPSVKKISFGSAKKTITNKNEFSFCILILDSISRVGNFEISSIKGCDRMR